MKEYKNFCSDLNKFKLTEDEVNKMKEIITCINVIKMNIDHYKSLQVPNEIYDNLKN